MSTMLPFKTPSVATSFKGALLKASSHVTNQYAGVALRSWWRMLPSAMRAQQGLKMTRHELIHRNNEEGTKTMPLLEFHRKDAAGRMVMLMIFSDMSAAVARSVLPCPYDADVPNYPNEEFHVLPIVLRLSSIARRIDPAAMEADGLGDIKLSVRGTKGILLSLKRERDNDSWVNIAASWTTEVNQITLEVRQELREAIEQEAEVWSGLIDDLPVLVSPITGAAPSGILTHDHCNAASICTTFAGRPYGACAAMPWQGIGAEHKAALQELCRQFCIWLQIKTKGVFWEIETGIQCNQPRQAKAKMILDRNIHIRCALIGKDDDGVAADMENKARAMLASIFNSDLSPVNPESLIGQFERDWKDRRTWMVPDKPVQVFARPEDRLASNHEQIAMMQRFEPFWIA